MIQSSVWLRVVSLSMSYTNMQVGVSFYFLDSTGSPVSGSLEINLSPFAPRSAAVLNAQILQGAISQINATYSLTLTDNDAVLIGGVD